MKRELAAISAQDDFARWANLRRQHDKALEEHDKRGMKGYLLGQCVMLMSLFRRRCGSSSYILRYESNHVPMDLYQWSQVWTTILELEDANLHLPARMVPVADRICTGLS